MPPAGPVRAFLSYAHEDQAWRDAVLGQLGWLRHSGELDVFYDPLIAPGQPWGGRIRDELRAWGSQMWFHLAGSTPAGYSPT